MSAPQSVRCSVGLRGKAGNVLEILGYAVCNLQFPVGICLVCLRRGCVLCLLQARREFERTTF